MSDRHVRIRQSYEADGYVFPVKVLDAHRAAGYRAMFESLEAEHEGDDLAIRILQQAATVVVPFVHEIMRLPSILDPVKDILGDDLVVMGATFFSKEPGSNTFVSWHQDLTYWGFDDACEVTAWLALTPSTPENGCVRFLPGSHRDGIVEHCDTFDALNLLTRGQVVSIEVDEQAAVDVALRPGEMSLHHGHLIHSSRPNTSSERRLGLAIRYLTPKMQQRSGRPPVAHLVAGENTNGRFELLETPTEATARQLLANVRQTIA